MLPREDLGAARAEIAKGVKKLAESKEPTVDSVNALLRLDEGCHATLMEILRGYLDAPSPKGNAQTIGIDVESIYGWLGKAYYRFVVAYHETRTSARQIAQLMTLVIARGLFALANQAKWAYFKQDSPPEQCWERLHTLYEFAELDEVDTRPVTLFAPPYEILTCCGGLYSRAALLSALNSGSFTAKQIETADHWLLAWTSGLLLNRLYLPGEHYYATLLQSSEPPRRIREAVNDPRSRYIRTANLAIEIDRAKAKLREGAAQHDMGFIPVQPMGESNQLLDQLGRLWTSADTQAEQRKNQRVKVDNEAISMVRGLNGICESARQDYERAHGPLDVNRGLTRDEEMDLQVYGFITERTRSKVRSRPLDATQPTSALEVWTLVDESIDGFGIAFATGTYRELKLGTLVGIKRRKTERWAVGTVVRVRNHRPSAQTFAGIDLVSLGPVIITLGEDAPPETLVKTSQLVWGLFVPGDKAHGQPDSLLVDRTVYSPAKQMIMGARNVRYTIRLGKEIRSGEGWRRTTFEVIGKRA